jgi:hypothetical protein
MTTLVLRALAVLIAVAGVIDPAFTMAGHSRARVAIVVQDTPTMALPGAGGATRRAVAERVRGQLTKNLGRDYDVQPRLTSDAAAAIVIGDSYPVATGSSSSAISGFSRTVATVTVSGDLSPDVRIVGVHAPRDVAVGTGIRLGIDVEGAGLSGQPSTLVVRVGGLEVGRVSHVWRGERERWHADVDAVPVGEPPFTVRVEAEPLDAERTPLDNVADALVDVRRTPLRVEVYEPRPSWATTFIRRALEGDPRFEVSGLSATSKSVATRSGDAATLTNSSLDRFDVVIVGGLERLTATEAQALERFMRDREGAVILVPDAKPATAAALDLVRGLTFTEQLSERPEKLATVAPLAPIHASELLLIGGDTPLAERLAFTSGANPSSVIVSMPRGGGRLVVSGALDAWRFRIEDDNAFDRFWQSTIAGLALAAPPPIDVSVTPAVLKPGELAEVIVRVRGETAALKGPPYDIRMLGGGGRRDSGRSDDGRRAGLSGPPEERAVRVSVDGRPVRLWPDAEAGVFRGSFAARDTAGRSTVVAQEDGTSRAASRPVIVAADARRPLAATTAPLSLLSASHHGIDVTPDSLGEAERFIRRTVPAPPATVTRRPMRSAWWMFLFAACLSGEWYLRRRRGAH